MRPMARVPVFLMLAGSFAAGAPLPASAAWADQPDNVIANVVAKVQGSVVRIIAVKKPKPAGDDKNPQVASASDARPMTAIGSGFVIDSSGLIATNRHVVDDTVSLFVGTSDGGRYRAAIVGAAEKADIALLRIQPDKPMPAVTFGDSDKLRSGDTVIAIGSPFGFDDTVTAGVVSGTNRDIMESPVDEYIQTDAAINHGNSGGPLFNLQGQVVGMNSVLFAPKNETGSVGLGFAIPSDELRFVYGRLEKYGAVRAGMLPLRTQQVTELMARGIGAPGPGGALVIGLEKGASVMGGSIQPGDIIKTFNGEPVIDPRDLNRKAAVAAIGSKATLGLCRGGKTLGVTVPILPFDTVPEYNGKMPPRPSILGLSFAKSEDASTGVTITAINPAGSAADSGLQTGDIVLRVRQETVTTPEEAEQALAGRTGAKSAYTALLVQRNDKQSWVPIALPH